MKLRLRIMEIAMLVIASAILISPSTINPQQGLSTPAYRNAQLPVVQRVADLLGRMTLEEKVAQTHALWQRKALIMDARGNFAPEKAKEVLKKARDGEDFAELAKKYSKGPFVKQGGDFGYRERKSIKKEIADAAFSMKKGEFSEPVKAADGGYHIIKLVDHVEAGIPPFGDVKDRVAIEYGRKLVADKISDVRKAVKFQIDSKELEGVKTD